MIDQDFLFSMVAAADNKLHRNRIEVWKISLRHSLLTCAFERIQLAATWINPNSMWDVQYTYIINYNRIHSLWQASWGRTVSGWAKDGRNLGTSACLLVNLCGSLITFHVVWGDNVKIEWRCCRRRDIMPSTLRRHLADASSCCSLTSTFISGL